MPEIVAPYHPIPTPQFGDVSVTRFLDDELHRIAAWAAEVNPRFAYCVVRATGSVALTTTPTWVNPLVGESEIIDLPDGSWGDATGIYTCPDPGLYQLSASVTFNVVGGVGNRQVAVGLRWVVNGTPGTEWVTSATDEFPITVSSSGVFPLAVNDTVAIEVAGYTSNPGGATADTQVDLNIWRLG